MFERISRIWNTYGFEITVGFFIVLLIVLAICNRNKKGSWDGFDIIKLPGNRPPVESRGEKECRRVLEAIFSRPFPKTRPDFLKNPVGVRGNNLEIDCYCEELKLGCEYDGIQHRKFVKHFHGTKDAFQNQQYRDYIKKELCKKNGVTLLNVPDTVKPENIKNYLISELTKLGIIKI